MFKKILHFLNEDVGATTVEYAVMLMLIIAGSIVLIQGIGVTMNDVWTDNSTKMNNAMNQ